MMERRNFILTIAASMLLADGFLSEAQARIQAPPEKPQWVKILLLANGVTVGAVFSATINETAPKPYLRDVDGRDLSKYVPPKLTDITCTTIRIRFDKKRLSHAFRHNKVHPAWQRMPLDMKVISPNMTTEVKNMWLLNNNMQYEADDFVIVDVSKWAAESINTRGDVAESG